MVRRKKPLVSTIIPTYNSAYFLPEAIESVLNQTYENIEIIVVDDGSTDNTQPVLTNYLQEIIYIRQENCGAACARNVGIERAQGCYVAFLDADDVWMPLKIATQVAVIEKHPDVGLVYSRIVNFSDQTGEDLSVWPARIYSGKVFEKLLLESFILLSSVLIRANLLKSLGGFNKSLITAEDTNLFIRAAMCSEIVGLDRILLKRRIHNDNLSNRFDIPVGTLDNFSLLAQEYPQLHPRRYRTMKQAYWTRGMELVRDSMYHWQFATSRKACLRILPYHPVRPTLWFYLLLSLFPPSIVRMFKNFLNRLRSEPSR